ncbi:MAG: hypothetical protein HYY15_03540 [Candidatus Omnitrophica bacterium]|nr:hypothetical protein [Candidatus Omnitrophota bacterium]
MVIESRFAILMILYHLPNVAEAYRQFAQRIAIELDCNDDPCAAPPPPTTTGGH